MSRAVWPDCLPGFLVGWRRSRRRRLDGRRCPWRGEAARMGEALGRSLRAERHRRGLSREELADRAGISARTIGNLERGSTHAYRHTVEMLADALDLDAGE